MKTETAVALVLLVGAIVAAALLVVDGLERWRHGSAIGAWEAFAGLCVLGMGAVAVIGAIKDRARGGW